jgi:hypothetical protein
MAMFNLLSGYASMDGNISLQFSGVLADVIGWLRPIPEAHFFGFLRNIEIDFVSV